MLLLSPSALPEMARMQVISELNARLADTIDLWSVFKTAHWNLRGPQFISLHEMLDGFATYALEAADTMAERITAYGGVALGGTRTVARISSIAEYPAGLIAGADHLRAVYERVSTWLMGLRASRDASRQQLDAETENMLIEFITAGEKIGWKIAATIDPAAATTH